MSGLTLRSQIGNSAVAYVSLPVYEGKMQQTVDFFNELGFKEDKVARVVFGGGEARFVFDSTQTRIQLTSISGFTPEPEELQSLHLALHVKSAAVAAARVCEWAEARQIQAVAEPADESNNKWFVDLRFLPWDIEFVTYETPLF